MFEQYPLVREYVFSHLDSVTVQIMYTTIFKYGDCKPNINCSALNWNAWLLTKFCET